MKPLTMRSFLLWLRLKSLFETADPESLSPLQKEFARVNGFRLLPPGANPELVAALRETPSSPGPALDFNVEDLLASVSVNTGIPVAELRKMPVPEFNRLRDAADRSIHYKLCTLALLLGARFGMWGFFAGYCLAGFVSVILGWAYFLSGRWDKRKVLQ